MRLTVRFSGLLSRFLTSDGALNQFRSVLPIPTPEKVGSLAGFRYEIFTVYVEIVMTLVMTPVDQSR